MPNKTTRRDDDAKALQAQVLLYNIAEGDRAERIKGYLRGAGIGFMEVCPQQYGQNLGALLGVEGFEKQESTGGEVPDGEGIPEEMLVLFSFDEEMTRDFFRFFRDEGLEGVALKAAVTPTNIYWTSEKLYQAIASEHAMIQAYLRKGGQDL